MEANQHRPAPAAGNEEVEFSIHIATSEKCLQIKCPTSTSPESLCTMICRLLNITPIAKNLFALQIRETKLFLGYNTSLEGYKNFDLRIRFRVPDLLHLRELDYEAYKYYYHQVRRDVLENKIPEIIYSKYREELLGLGISDMYRVMIDEKKSCDDVMKDYKKYIPKEITKKHSIFTKKPIYSSLDLLKTMKLTSDFIIEKYLSQFESMAPNYLSEEYSVIIEKNGDLHDGMLFVRPFHHQEPGLSIMYHKGKSAEHLCTINQLIFMTIRTDVTVELSRMNGIPVYVKFDNLSQMRSFVSICDGYYRLMVKWTFNICKDMPSSELATLHSMKCHGPIGGVFSYHKLEKKRSNKPGSFILRQCEKEYDVYYVDVCNKQSLKPMTHKIQRYADGYIFDKNSNPIYPAISDLVAAYKNPDNEICFQDCIPPSEYDKSQLLLCQPPELSKMSNINQDDLDGLLNISKGPQCINSKDIQVFRGTRIDGSENVSCFYKARWNVTEGKKMDIAMRMLKQDCSDTYLKDFIDQAGQWAFLKSSAIVRLYGVTLRSPVAMIMELLPLGPLDLYLQLRERELQLVDLVEAAANVATALWYLEENGIVHGNIRCRKLLVACHDSSKFSVKLSDRGLHPADKDYDIHWIPIEFYNNLTMARKSSSTDVWAFATTLWEIFSFGLSPNGLSEPLTKKHYLNGTRLTRPKNCPDSMYHIMRNCWFADPHKRSRPQVIMRDVNQLLYQGFNSRRKHLYSTISNQFQRLTSIDDSRLQAASDAYNDNDNTGSDVTSIVDFDPQDDLLLNEQQWSGDPFQHLYSFENYTLVLQGIIGQGYYGYVFKGTLNIEENGQIQEVKTVAVKKLKPNCQSDDFVQEIEIAKTLKHPNIVEINGIIDKPEILLIMEYIPHGNLVSYLKIHRLNISLGQLMKYALDIAQGMEYLESKHVVHRDLAARNILVINENQVKISDFGLAREMDQAGYYMLKSDRALPLNWYAPESKSLGKFSSKSDVWSYGVMLWEMFSYGNEPPQCDPENENEFRANFTCPEACPSEVYSNLMISCWKFLPHNRPSFSEISSTCQQFLEHY